MKKEESKIVQTRKYLKRKILLNKYDTRNDHEKEWAQVHELFKRTLETGESNSVLLIGPRGVGKTSLVNDVVEEFKKNNAFVSDGILVKLHGLIHTDDRLALKSITTQMKLDNAVNGKVFGSFAENLAFLLACLRTGRQESTKSVIFILDEFDLFCSHHNQTLLYNLFDVSQSAQTPICVFGISCRLDVIELLEKRVKSRFSHRQMFLFSPYPDNSELTPLELQLKKIQNILILDSKELKLPNSYLNQWNSHIKELISNKKFVQLIQFFVEMIANHQVLKNILLIAVSKLNEANPNLKLEYFKEEINRLEKDDLISILQDLSVLELCLIISMKHHIEIYDNQPLNFEMVYTRYAKFASRNSNMQASHRTVVMKAFEHLISLELIAPLSGATSRLQKEYQMFKLLVTAKQINEAIKNCAGLPTEVLQWANSSLV